MGITPNIMAQTHQNNTSLTTYSDSDLTQAKQYGFIDNNGTIYLKNNDGTTQPLGSITNMKNKDTILNLYARRYLDLKQRALLLKQHIQTAHTGLHTLATSITTLQKDITTTKYIGDNTSLNNQITELSQLLTQKETELKEQHRQALETSLTARTTIVTKAEALAQGLDESTNWKNTAEEFKALFTEWQGLQKTQVRLDEATEKELWGRFSAARSSFNEARHAWIEQREQDHEKVRRAKKDLIEQARLLEDSHDFAATSKEFSRLMEDWKHAGRINKQEDDALWAEFRKSADVFFTAREEERTRVALEEQAHVAQKEALLEQITALVSTISATTIDQVKKEINPLLDAWDEVGHVPQEQFIELEKKLSTATAPLTSFEEKKWSEINTSTDHRYLSFKEQIMNRLHDIDMQLATETDPQTRQKLEEEKVAKKQWLETIS